MENIKSVKDITNTRLLMDIYSKKVFDKIDTLYEDIISSIDIFNEYLMEQTANYQTAKEEVSKAIKKELPLEDIIDIIDSIKEEDLVASKIKLKQTIINDILKNMDSIGEVTKTISEIKEELQEDDNLAYLISSLQDSALVKIKEYSELTASGFLKNNPYLDMYISTRNDFMDYTKKALNDSVDIETESIEDKEIKDIKYKQRLRCTYDELQKFARHVGYEDTRQGNTTHVIWKNRDTGKSLPIPNKSGTVPQGTVSRILKQMELSRNDLANYLYQ